MRGLNTLSAAGVTTLNLGDLEWVPANHRVYIKGHDSVATATLTVTVGGVTVFSGPLAIEEGTDVSAPWTKVLTQFTIGRDRARMSATLGGTVAGARVDFLICAPSELGPNS